MSKITFPKIGEKHNFTPLFGARHIIKNPTKIPRKVVFIYQDKLEIELNQKLHLKKSDVMLGFGGAAWKFTNFVTPDNKLFVVRLPAGAPLVAIAVEETIVSGATEFLTLGTAGGLSKRLSIGSMVLCTKAIRDEGTSHHYVRNSKYAIPDKALTAKLENAMSRNKIAFFKGSGWSIDAPYVETKEEIEHYRKAGVLTVDMEASALFAVAKKRGAKAAVVFTISDILGSEWSSLQNVDSGYKKLVKIAEIFKTL